MQSDDISCSSTTPRRRVTSMGNFGSYRKSKKADIVTGAISAKNTREQIATIRPPKERQAMGRISRHRVEPHWWFTRPCRTACYKSADFCCGKDDYDHHRREDEEDGGESEEEDDVDMKPQYTLQSRVRVTRKSLFPFQSFRQKICYCCSRSTMTSDEYHPEGKKNYLFFLDVNDLISKYLSWIFRTSYFALLNVCASLYFGQILIFALVFFVISLKYPQCINSNGEMIGDSEGSRIFLDCFQLSWTTFSTVWHDHCEILSVALLDVFNIDNSFHLDCIIYDLYSKGYGIIFPATGASAFHVPNSCVSMGVLGSFEAFLGVLYADFCAALLFGKVLRSQNNAQVYFSDPIVIRFGKAELSDGNNNNKSEDMLQGAKDGYDEELGGSNIPCPSLEFRLVNRLHGVPSGEIVEAKLDCVAILDPKLSKTNKSLPNDTSTIPEEDDSMSMITTIAELAQALESRAATRSIAFHSTGSKQPHMFTKISLDADEHPFFRRVWFGRHRLDENSPLLTPDARKMVQLANGYWPAHMNNHQSIKRSLQFRHILVCIRGTANANAAPVYAQKVYDLVDVNVGYRFVPLNYHTDDGLKTDPYLLNAVYQQRGGGAEAFNE
ncbi:hypothetical protein ACHAXR_004906 [Thalassiosira sp. AJA248-18]